MPLESGSVGAAPSSLPTYDALLHPTKDLPNAPLSSAWRDVLERIPTAADVTPRLKSPCWRRFISPFATAWTCLPYVFLLGVPKCGTTELYYLLCSHPELVCTSRAKEPGFWRTFDAQQLGVNWSFKLTLDKNHYSFEDYLRWHESRTDLIIQRRDEAPSLISIDASVDTWYHFAVDSLNWNRSLYVRHWKPKGEALVPLPVTMHTALPQAKLLVIFREPVARLWSSYLFIKGDMLQKGVSGPNFDKLFVKEVAAYRACEKLHGDRCAFGLTGSYAKHEPRAWGGVVHPNFPGLNAGLYVVHYRVWSAAYKDAEGTALLVLRFEDLTSHTTSRREELLDKVAAHLGLRSPLPRQAASIYAQPSLRIKNTSTKAHATIPMANATLRLLEGFYYPYNAALAKELKDERWLWADAKPVCDPCM